MDSSSAKRRRENTVRDSMDAVVERTRRLVEHSDEPLSAVIQGVDDAWEVCS